MNKISTFIEEHRLALLLAASIVIILLYPWLFRTFGNSATTFVLLPVMLAGWFYGLRTGLLCGFGALLVSVFFSMIVGGPEWDQARTVALAAGFAALISAGGLVGYLSDLRKKLAGELIDRQQIETALRVSESFNQAVLQALSANIAVLNRTGEIVAVNEAWKKFAFDNGAPEDRTGVGMNYLKVCRAATGDGAEVAYQTAQGIQSVLEGKENLFTLEYPCHSPRQKRWFVLHVTPLTLGGGGVVVSHINITDRVLSEQRLAFLAIHDALTGLYNRAFFEQQLADLQAAHILPVSFVIADIDGLKRVNDQLGHSAGDDLLRRAAEVLRSAFRDNDALARIGGDEFAVILPEVDEKRAQIILDRVTSRLRDAETAGGPVALRMSVGTATATRSEEMLSAMKEADEKMYQAKVKRKG